MTAAICPILGRETAATETNYSVGHWKIVRCEETGFVYLSNPPSYEQLEQEFAWEKTAKQERERRVAKEPFMQAISDTAKQAKQAKQAMQPQRNKTLSLLCKLIERQPSQRQLAIVDVGCGTGELLVRMVEQLH